ncbi:hypothetical protein [Nonomuraea solani]|uniref:hypothetical protein n=1 Tax=Nonomuraea solani TaxID=1144553 RepID=UPI00190F01DA|nr:hypothetical protein [Nonomuraea solani]
MPEYPRATSSPPIVVLIAGLAALVGFLLGVSVGFGAGETSDEPAPRVTVTVDDSPPPSEPTDPAGTAPPASTPPPGQSDPAATPPGQTPPGQTPPGQTPPGQTPPGQTPPGSTGNTGNTGNAGNTGTTPPAQSTPGGGTGGVPTFNTASLRTLVVGADIQPGTYRTTGPTKGFSMCYWARMRSADGDIIATGMPTGPATVTIQATDKVFHTGGCAEWTKA